MGKALRYAGLLEDNFRKAIFYRGPGISPRQVAMVIQVPFDEFLENCTAFISLIIEFFQYCFLILAQQINFAVP